MTVVVEGVSQPLLIHVGLIEIAIVKSESIEWCVRGFVVLQDDWQEARKPRQELLIRPRRTSDSMHSSGVSFVVRHSRKSAVASGDVQAPREILGPLY